MYVLYLILNPNNVLEKNHKINYFWWNISSHMNFEIR